jgi:hypothetical protein
MMRCSAPLVLAMALLGTSVGAAGDRGSLRATVRFDRTCSTNAWFGAFGGKKHYVVSLEPVFDLSYEPIGWDLSLKGFGETENLLEPAGEWHGLQAYNLGAEDLAHGIDRSAFGRVRSFKSDGGRTTITLEVQEAAVATDSKGRLRLTVLKVLVSAGTQL